MTSIQEQLQDKLFSMSSLLDMKVDRMDIGITIFQAMKENECEDLLEMIHFLETQAFEEKTDRPTYILAQAMHDIYGFKAEYLSSVPAGFSPRSSGYATLT